MLFQDVLAEVGLVGFATTPALPVTFTIRAMYPADILMLLITMGKFKMQEVKTVEKLDDILVYRVNRGAVALRCSKFETYRSRTGRFAV